jgi:hypothetical protein
VHHPINQEISTLKFLKWLSLFGKLEKLKTDKQ